jgi:putative ABC transport system permease protein
MLGVVLARPLLGMVTGYAARFSIRALDVTVDTTVLGVGAGLAMIAAVLLAYVPRLPSEASTFAPSGLRWTGLGLANGSLRITPGTNRRLRIFATAQIAFSFMLLAGAGMLLATLVTLQTANTGYDMRHVLAFDIPTSAPGAGDARLIDFYQETIHRIGELPGVDGAALGMFVPWRDAGSMGAGVAFTAEGYTPENGEENPRARFRVVSPRFFAVVGVPIVAGRDFNDEDRDGNEPVVIVSQSVAQRLFPNGDAVNRKMWWVDPYFGPQPLPRRIVGIVADTDDENVVRGPALAVYHPVRQIGVAGRLFVRAAGDPYALVPAVRRVIRGIAPEQPVERPATLADVRAQVLSPERLSAFVFSGFAGIALLIAIVGVAGVLAFSVSARTREFGVRLAVGCAPRRLLTRVLSEGVQIAAIGIAMGAVGGYLLARVATGFFPAVQVPGVLPVLGAAAVLIGAAVAASLVPAARASRVDVLQALRSE